MVELIPIRVQLDLPVCSLTFAQGACTAPAGTQCYNTWHTCQSKADYAATTKPLKLTFEPTNDPTDRPYLLSCEHKSQRLTTEGLTDGADSVRVVAQDAPAVHDLDDPYNRVGQGTWWLRLAARQPYLQGISAQVTAGNLTTRWVVSDVTLPDANSVFTVQLVSPVSELSTHAIPEQTPEYLTGNLSIGTTNRTLSADHFAIGDYAAIDTEIVKKTGASTIERGQLGTAAADHERGANIQRVFRLEAPETTLPRVLYAVLVAGGFGAFVTKSDFTDLEATPHLNLQLDDFTLPESDQLETVLEQLLLLAGLTLIWDVRLNKLQLIDASVFAATPVTVSEEQFIYNVDPPTIRRRNDLVFTRVQLRYGLSALFAGELKNAAVAVSGDAESGRYTPRHKVLSKEVGLVPVTDSNIASLADSAALRTLGRSFSPAGPPFEIQFTVPMAASEIQLGSTVLLKTGTAVQGVAGTPLDSLALVVSETFKFREGRITYVCKSFHEQPAAAVPLSITADAQGYDAFAAAGSPAHPLMVSLRIAAGVVVTPTVALESALRIVGFHPDSEITVELEAGSRVVGFSGAGGDAEADVQALRRGQAGGTAVLTGAGTFTFTGSGQIAGGGGGGGSAIVEQESEEGEDVFEYYNGGAGAGYRTNAILETPQSGDDLAGAGGAFGQAGQAAAGGDSNYAGGAAGSAVLCQGSAAVVVEATVDLQGAVDC